MFRLEAGVVGWPRADGDAGLRFFWNFTRRRLVLIGRFNVLCHLCFVLCACGFRVIWARFGLVLVWFVFGLVWFGLVWFGLVWFGLVRFGLVLVWFGLVWFGLVWFGFDFVSVWYGLAWPGLVWCGVAWFSLVDWFGCVVQWLAFSPVLSFLPLSFQLFRILAALLPHCYHIVPALIQHCYRTFTALQPRDPRAVSTLLPHYCRVHCCRLVTA